MAGSVNDLCGAVVHAICVEQTVDGAPSVVAGDKGMSAPARWGNARIEPEKGESNVQKHVKFEASTLRVSSHDWSCSSAAVTAVVQIFPRTLQGNKKDICPITKQHGCKSLLTV